MPRTKRKKAGVCWPTSERNMHRRNVIVNCRKLGDCRVCRVNDIWQNVWFCVARKVDECESSFAVSPSTMPLFSETKWNWQCTECSIVRIAFNNRYLSIFFFLLLCWTIRARWSCVREIKSQSLFFFVSRVLQSISDRYLSHFMWIDCYRFARNQYTIQIDSRRTSIVFARIVYAALHEFYAIFYVVCFFFVFAFFDRSRLKPVQRKNC